MKQFAQWLIVVFAALISNSTQLARAQTDDELAERAVAILNSKCSACHGADKAENQLRLDSLDAMIRGGEKGAAIFVGKARESLVVQSIRDTDEATRMPPKDPLSETEIAIIEDWINAGAKWPSAKHMSAMNSVQTIGNAWDDPRNPIRKLFRGERLDLWSLRPIARSMIPVVRQQDWATNPIDNFVLTEWEKWPDFETAPKAGARELAIRAAFGLTGLPPEIKELEAFVNSDDERAYEQLIERWLSHPSYGVRWARMWLDVVRYSDSNGFDWDEFRPNAWRYRDYVIEAWNRDLPFDQFTLEQLAGDELVGGPPNDELDQQRLIATGYLRVGPHDNSSPLFNEQERSRAQLLADLTETTGSAFLGLTLGCCRCHDHKTDPLSHADHYRLRAFFAPVEFADDLPLDLPERRTQIEQHNAEIDEQVAVVDSGVAAVHAGAKVRIASAAKAEKVEPTEEAVKKGLNAVEKKLLKDLAKRKGELEAKKLGYTHGLLMRDKPQDIPATYVLYQGDHSAPRESVAVGFPSVLEPNEASVFSNSEKSTGRRSALAEWIVARRNPWTARVIVNRLWQVHFGEGLVATPNDFGITGSRPTHPELLDWLASELIDSGWSIKHVQRLIVTSSVYRQATVTEVGTRPRMSLRNNLRRLEAEALRDRILVACGLLDQRIGGPPVWPEIPAEILQANPAFLDDNATKTKGWYPSPAETQSVRSLFLVQKRTVRIPFLETFDLPDNSVSCARREASLVAPQALTLLNGELVEQAATALANTISMRTKVADEQCRLAFQQTLLRQPSEHELTLAVAFLKTHSLDELCRALLNTNEFAFIE